MAKWDGWSEPVFIGDAVGNPVAVRVDLVQVNKRITAGFKAKPGVTAVRDDELPDYTMDVAALSDLITRLEAVRRDLIRKTGGMG